jgi:Chromosome segregation ATPases
MSGRIADEILNNPQLLSALAEKIYEKLKDEIVIKKLEENSESIKTLQEEIRKHSEVIASLQQTVDRHTEAIVSFQQAVKSLQETVDRHTEAIKSLQEAVKKQGEAIASLQETVNRHTLAIEGLQEAVKKQGEAIASLQETVNRHTLAIEGLQEAVKKQGEAIASLQETVNRHTLAIEGLQEAVKKQGEAIASLQETVKKHGEAIEALQKAVLRLGREVKKLSVEVGSFTNRAGKGMEKVMLKLYKKALELHGVDPRRVVHGFITDDEGVIEKGKVFEVDFYETNDYVYVFEIKNLADKGAYDQIIIRKKLFSTKYKNKKIKIFLVANFVDKNVKKKLEEEGVEIIASHVIK